MMSWMKQIQVLVAVCCLGICCRAADPSSFLISGQVVDYQARPVVGAELAVYEGQYQYRCVTETVLSRGHLTDRLGRFSFAIPQMTQRQTMLVARKAGLALGWDGLNYGTNTKAQGNFLLVLERPCTLSGIVVDHQGQPVSGASVQALPKTSYMSRLSQRPVLGPRDWFTVTTDEQGRFRFDQMSPDVSTDLRVSSATHTCTYMYTTHYQNCCGFALAQKGIRLVLPREYPVKGRAMSVDSNKPIPGVELVILTGRDREDIVNRYAPVILTTDTVGQYTCPGLPEGKHRLMLASENEGAAAWAALPVDFNVCATQPPEEVQIELEKGGLVEFTAREYGTDQLLEGIRVSAYSNSGRGESKTDRFGKAKVRLVPGEYGGSASGQGYDYWRANERIVVRAGETSHVEVILDKDPCISGMVRDAAGKPVSQTLVTIHPFGDHVLSDGQGGFVAGYDKGRADQGVYVFARAPSLSLANVVFCNDLEKPLEVSLKPTLTVTGSIVDANNLGIPAARVKLHVCMFNCLSDLGEEVLTDAQGRYTFRAVPAQVGDFDYRVSVHATDYGPQTYKPITIEGELGQSVELEPLVLASANMSLSGVVVDPNGVPAPRVILFLRGDDDTEQPDKSLATSDKGEFKFTRICPGQISIQVDFGSGPYGSGRLKAAAGDHGIRAIMGQNTVHVNYASLLGQALPDLTGFGLPPNLSEAENQAVLICFFDQQQRPSRELVRKLASQAESLAQQGMQVVLVQATAIDGTALRTWCDQERIPFDCGMVTTGAEKTHLAWGVKSFPWFILTDKQHVVQSEGLSLWEIEGM